MTPTPTNAALEAVALHPIDALRDMVEADIARNGTLESIMIRAGLLRDLLAELAERRALTSAGEFVVVPRGLLCSIFRDYMTSENHHPNHVLIGRAEFETLREVFDNTPAAAPQPREEGCE